MHKMCVQSLGMCVHPWGVCPLNRAASKTVPKIVGNNMLKLAGISAISGAVGVVVKTVLL
jgi:hypothetical protein